MTPILDATPHIEAGVAAIKAAWTPGFVYPFGEVPGTNQSPGDEPETYIRVSVERRFSEPNRVGRSGRVGWRTSLRFVSPDADNVRDAQFAVATALNQVRLTVGADTTTPVIHETTGDLGYDEGRYVADATYTYVC